MHVINCANHSKKWSCLRHIIDDTQHYSNNTAPGRYCQINLISYQQYTYDNKIKIVFLEKSSMKLLTRSAAEPAEFLFDLSNHFA